MFTCVGWKVTLCDLIWQVTPRSSETTCSGELYRLTLAFNLRRTWPDLDILGMIVFDVFKLQLAPMSTAGGELNIAYNGSLSMNSETDATFAQTDRLNHMPVQPFVRFTDWLTAFNI